MTYNSTIRLAQIERVACALYDAAKIAPEEGKPVKGLNGLAWGELDDDKHPIKAEFRAMATIAVEAMNENTNDELDEDLRQFQLPAVMAELSLLSKADALRLLYAAIEQTMETRG